jgi:hypothetical protein
MTQAHDPVEPADRFWEQTDALLRVLVDEDPNVDGTARHARTLLTDGYAYALVLSAECLKLDRMIAQLADSGDEGGFGVLRSLTQRRRRTAAKRDELRRCLADFRVRAETTSPR